VAKLRTEHSCPLVVLDTEVTINEVLIRERWALRSDWRVLHRIIGRADRELLRSRAGSGYNVLILVARDERDDFDLRKFVEDRGRVITKIELREEEGAASR
jgi:hypothetical protein